MEKTGTDPAAKAAETRDAMAQGKGTLRLEFPITCMGEEHKELPYDFMSVTGLEYVRAMDSDPQAGQAYRITYRQALALFATAAAKNLTGVDARDIQESISVTDAVGAVQLATVFFNASTRAALMRISKG